MTLQDKVNKKVNKAARAAWKPTYTARVIPNHPRNTSHTQTREF